MSSKVREQEVFACMVHNLFEEWRFFPRYPEKVSRHRCVAQPQACRACRQLLRFSEQLGHISQATAVAPAHCGFQPTSTLTLSDNVKNEHGTNIRVCILPCR
jgi:hypothetical protein